MADDSEVVDTSTIVTRFLLGTYRLQPTTHYVAAHVRVEQIDRQYSENEPEADRIPLLSGSSAELYIKPMMSCVSDIDVMYHRSTQLAIPVGYPVPTNLPNEFHSRVEVFEIINTEYPGYVYLKSRYVLTESGRDGTYNFALEARRKLKRVPALRNNVQLHGPAVTIVSPDPRQPSTDEVYCVRCLSWPTQAADWPTRHRNHGWPDSATVDHVVSNGCDLVQVAHRRCRHDEQDSKSQWRLSFSRAEVVLLNSWSQVQQAVYHMLRVLMKKERLVDITENTEITIISNYNIKTLMLWACELKPRSWWNENDNIVRNCVELLHVAAEWLSTASCPHYFISNCDLVEYPIIVKHLSSVTESTLSTWFVKNYLTKCAQVCPDDISQLFHDVSTTAQLQTAASAVADWRRNTASWDLWTVHNMAQFSILHRASKYSLTAESSLYWRNEFSKIDTLLSHYYTAVALLQLALKFTRQDYDTELMEVLLIIIGQFTGRRPYSNDISSVLSLSRATILMKVVANSSCNTLQLIEIELSKAYLYRALRCKDSDNDSIYCLANVYLAVLYYTTGQYQTAIDHCTLVMRSQDHSQCSSHVVQGELLPHIDDNIDSVLGLLVFYKFIRTAALNGQQRTHVCCVFTTELFARYLLIRCLSTSNLHRFAKTSRLLPTDEIQHYRKNICERTEMRIGDTFLFRSVNSSVRPQFDHKSLIHQRQQPTTGPTELNTSELVGLLQQSAVEHLTTCRHLEAQRFGCAATIVTTDFELMYAYKRGDYQRCLELSTQNVRTLLYASSTTCIVAYPEFIQLLDDGIASLTALTLIVNSQCRTGQLIFQRTLSLYLMTECQLKLRHSATQLAQTLDYIELAQRRCPPDGTLDHLTLKLTRRKAMLHLKSITNY